jgi:Protein of unknown function DUF262
VSDHDSEPLQRNATRTPADDAEAQLELLVLEPEPLLPDQGETESDIESHDPTDFDAAISSTDWTVETLLSQMRKGRIDLNPQFQRRNAWLDTRKSQLIESIMLRYPIPQLVLAAHPTETARNLVIDGKQRLLALRQFTAEEIEPLDEGFVPLKLRGLEILRELNGLTWAEVQARFPERAATFENHTIRTVVLSRWSTEDLLLSLFLRLNTGSVTLSPQELRQALHPGPFSEWLDDESGASPGLLELLGNTHPDRRMVDAELLLRYLALRFSPAPYRGNLKRFLDDTSGAFNAEWARWAPILRNGLADLEAAVAAAFETFGSYACRKWTQDRFERPFNRAVFDIQMISMSSPDVRVAVAQNREAVIDGFKSLCDSDEDFARSITVTTKSVSAFRTRFESWARLLRHATDSEFELPPPLYRE